ncbi:ATP-binding protein [uncultured Devosia sp.]|uniref:sensor histidine kinase n=1 Tax=uncultured Devosia sp. TaxID=211434 RepID=UPI0035CADFAE
MRSAEVSGVSAGRYGAGADTTDMRGETRAIAAKSGPSIRHRLAPVTTAVALTAILAATLFVLFDSARAIQDARGDLASIGRLIIEDLAELPPEVVSARLAAVAQRYSDTVRVSLHAGGEPARAGLVSTDLPVGSLGTLSLAMGPNQALDGVWQRGLGAYAAALLIIGLTYRRRSANQMPDATQRHHYQTLAMAVPMGIACWTADGQLIVCNTQYRDRLNLRGRNPTYHDAVKQLIVGGYMKLLNEDDSNRLLELHREDGSCLLIDERPLGDGSFMTLVSDVTERKKTDTLLNAIREEQRTLARRFHEEKLKAEAASRSKTNFLAHLSHDIRTPLNHIIGFAELMRQQTYGPMGDARYADYVQSIKASGEHLLASFATILDLAELESGQKPMRSDRVAVDGLIESVVQRFRGQAVRAGLSVVVGAQTGAMLNGDRLGLQRMLSNIVENAVRFTPAGGRINVAAFAAPDGVVIEISDTGIGMSEERLETLSHPFARGDATFTREGVGPGLGISIARAIAELSGGRIAIDSSLSLGTTVAISLPLQTANELQAAE